MFSCSIHVHFHKLVGDLIKFRHCNFTLSNAIVVKLSFQCLKKNVMRRAAHLNFSQCEVQKINERFHYHGISCA